MHMLLLVLLKSTGKAVISRDLSHFLEAAQLLER